MQRVLTSITLAFALVCLSGCDAADRNALVLPEGDAEVGRTVFVDLRCHACHLVQDLELPPIEREYSIPLGGIGSKTYPELVTSVVNPSHRLARGLGRHMDESPMSNYNDAMTVTQLVNVVEFLQTQYEVPSVPRYRYVPYNYGE
ncbi:MAG: c-type cytochrome [Pseudomonadota bacterium]